MSDAGYYAPGTNWIYGSPDTGDDPVVRAALQESAAQQNLLAKRNPNYVPPGLRGPKDPIVGWTVQNNTETPFRPYTPTGVMPDWTADVNPAGAGAYDQSPVVASFPVVQENRGPIGGTVFDGYSDSGDSNPNSAPFATDSNLGSDAEY